MPGVSVRSRRACDADRFADALASLRHFERYRAETVETAADGRLGYTWYPGYPVTRVRGDALTVVLEGRLYDRDLTRGDLLDLGAAVLDPATGPDLRQWLREVDGDFAVWVADDHTGTVAVVNDLFGRLPVYYWADGGDWRVSREPRFLLRDREVAFDRVGIAQTLLFGYHLGTRTLWEGVRTLPPASVLRAGGGDLSVSRLHAFDFSTKRYRGRSVERNARELAARFREAATARAVGDPTVVSLSGGHDSRAVAAALGTEGVPCRAATFARADGRAARDVTVARRVAAALDIPWDRYDVGPTTTDQARTLLDLKAGLNHVGMGFLLEFLESLRADHGAAAVYLTGDGGDKVLPDLTPPRSFRDLDALADYTVAKHSVFPPERAAALAGVDESRLRESVREVLASYPEPDAADRYAHFLTHERGFNWLFEGEDRNRAYLWSASPFYAGPVFRYAMNVPHEQKAKNRLYRAFLSTLWPPAVTFDDADFATPMDSLRYEVIQRALSVLERHPRLEDVVGRLYRGEVGAGEDRVGTLVAEQLAAADADDSVLGATREAGADDPGRSVGRHGRYTLLTVVAAVAAVTEGRTVLERREGVPLA